MFRHPHLLQNEPDTRKLFTEPSTGEVQAGQEFKDLLEVASCRQTRHIYPPVYGTLSTVCFIYTWKEKGKSISSKYPQFTTSFQVDTCLHDYTHRNRFHFTYGRMKLCEWTSSSKLSALRDFAAEYNLCQILFKGRNLTKTNIFSLLPFALLSLVFMEYW